MPWDVGLKGRLPGKDVWGSLKVAGVQGSELHGRLSVWLWWPRDWGKDTLRGWVKGLEPWSRAEAGGREGRHHASSMEKANLGAGAGLGRRAGVKGRQVGPAGGQHLELKLRRSDWT